MFFLIINNSGKVKAEKDNIPTQMRNRQSMMESKHSFIIAKSGKIKKFYLMDLPLDRHCETKYQYVKDYSTGPDAMEKRRKISAANMYQLNNSTAEILSQTCANQSI